MELEGGERNGLLTLGQFEGALVGVAMTAASTAGATTRKATQLFQAADLNQDGFIDLNEFVAMRRRTQKHQQKVVDRRHARGSHGTRGRGSSGTPNGTPNDIPQCTPEGTPPPHAPPGASGTWVAQLLDREEAEADLDRQAREAEARQLASRLAVHDSLHELVEDELHVLQEEVLPTVGTAALDVAACHSALELLAMRIGKMFAVAELERFVDDLVRASGDDRGRITPEQLVASLLAQRPARPMERRR